MVVLTTFDNDENVLAALRAGASGFLSKGVGPRELVDGIMEVVNGGGALSSAVASILIDHVNEETDPPMDRDLQRRFAALTPRELAVVQLILAGHDNSVIASRLFVSPFTVKTHANRAMAKVDARDRTQLFAFAFQAGLRPGTSYGRQP